MCVCVCVCARTRARARLCVCARARIRVYVHTRAHARQSDSVNQLETGANLRLVRARRLRIGKVGRRERAAVSEFPARPLGVTVWLRLSVYVTIFCPALEAVTFRLRGYICSWGRELAQVQPFCAGQQCTCSNNNCMHLGFWCSTRLSISFVF